MQHFQVVHYWAGDQDPSTYFIAAETLPTTEQVVYALQIDYEPDKGERIEIENAEVTILDTSYPPKNWEWGFIERHLPGYHARDDVLHSDILQRYLDDDKVDLQDVDKICGTLDRDKVAQHANDINTRLWFEALRNAEG